MHPMPTRQSHTPRRRWLPGLLAAAILSQGLLVSCPGGPSAPPAHSPTPERVVARSAERWRRVAAAEWVEAYSYLAPSVRKTTDLGTYLRGKATHVYEKPGEPQVLELSGDTAFLRATATWTPRHPLLDKVELEPGQTLTQAIEMIETWSWVDGDWFFVRADQPAEFFNDRPDLRPAPPPGQ